MNRNHAWWTSALVVLGLGLTGCAAAATPAPPAATPPAATTQAAPAKSGAVDPYAYLKKVPAFTVTSDTVKAGQPLPKDQMSGILMVPGGKDISPQLSWSGFPAETKSFVVSMYDPQAPTGSGFTHWVVADIPATTTSLPLGAGVPNSTMIPAPAFQLPADAGAPRYIGAAPPAGSGEHDYYVTVTALDVASAGVAPTASPALLGFTIGGHTIARASIMFPTNG